MGSKSKLINTSFKVNNLEGDTLKDGLATTAKFAASSVESSEINNDVITANDLAETLDLSSKNILLANTSVTAGMLSNTLDLSSKTVTIPTSAVNFDREYFNIALLGFKMATQENLTVFNLIDGIVDEFHDESGTDEAEGTNDFYCATNDNYSNLNAASFSAGFGLAADIPFASGSITEPDTSTVQRNNPQGYSASPTGRVSIDQELGTFTVPSGSTSVNMLVWGSGGGAGCGPAEGHGGGGGYSEGTLAVTGEQVLTVGVGFGGGDPETISAAPGSGDYARANPKAINTFFPGSGGHGGSGGGMSGVFTAAFDFLNKSCTFGQDGVTERCGSAENDVTNFTPFVPSTAIIAGAGGGSSRPGPTGTRITGGAGGGLIGEAGGGNGAQVTSGPNFAGGGSQTTGGESAGSCKSESSTHFYTGRQCSSGGSGFFGGGSGRYTGGGNSPSAGGGGSSYYGHPQVTSGSTESGAGTEGGGVAVTGYVAATNEGTDYACANANKIGEQGYVLLTGSYSVSGSSTIISNPFTSGSVPTTSRIVVFEENIDTPTLNTDIIASISRDGGTTFTNATLADSGYVTGASGQRILTGQATISGQPSGQSMRWKIALANNSVKIHGVSLSWA